jgi:DNA-binding transcriptional LysR family regulator
MDLARLSTDSLASFAVFADHLNFSRAAEELHISQPALHVKVRKLGETLGRPLYRRQGRRLALTSDGEAVARFARELDARMGAFLAELRGTVPDRPMVLAAGEGTYLYLLGDVIRDIPARLRLINGDHTRMLAAVRTGRADLGIGVLDVLPDDLGTALLASYPQTLVLPEEHVLAARSTLTLADLTGTALVVPPPHRPHRIALERALRAAGAEWSVAVEAGGWPLMLHFVALGVGLAVVNGCVRPPAGLVQREITDLPAVPYHAVYLPGRADDPPVAGLLGTLRTRLSAQ